MTIDTPPSSRQGDWKRHTLYFLLTTTLFTTGMATFTLTGLSPGPVPPVGLALIGASAGGLIFGAGMTYFLTAMSRRSGGFNTARSIVTALRRQALPNGIDHVEWRQILDRQEVSARRGRWLYPLLFGLFAILELTQALQGPWIFWVFTAFFAAMAAIAPFTMNRERTRIERLKKQLRDQAPAPD